MGNVGTGRTRLRFVVFCCRRCCCFFVLCGAAYGAGLALRRTALFLLQCLPYSLCLPSCDTLVLLVFRLRAAPLVLWHCYYLLAKLLRGFAVLQRAASWCYISPSRLGHCAGTGWLSIPAFCCPSMYGRWRGFMGSTTMCRTVNVLLPPALTFFYYRFYHGSGGHPTPLHSRKAPGARLLTLEHRSPPVLLPSP